MFALSHENHNTPIAFKDEVLPWIMQSPLMPHIAIFTASGYRAHTSGCEMANHTQTMAMKGMLLHRINGFLEEDFDKIHEQVIQSTLHLILMEVRRSRALQSCSKFFANWNRVVLLRFNQSVGPYERPPGDD
jgi:hypothetical protein